MNAAYERLLRAYRPLQLRGAMIEGAWLHRPLPANDRAPPAARLSLLAWLALVLPRRGRDS